MGIRVSRERPRPAGIPVQPNLDETIFSHWPIAKQIRRRLLAPIYGFCDFGLLGLTPLRTHIVICGFPRSGTTLLQAMLEHALPDARRFGKETSGSRAANHRWRNHAVMISKFPRDMFQLHSLRAYYRGRKAKLKTILMIRDPRDVLTSRHAEARAKSTDYFYYIDEWRLYYAYYLLYRNDPNVLVLRYEQLVADVKGEAAKVEAFVNEKFDRPAEDFHQELRDDFDTIPLNGVRPVESSKIGRWELPEHWERIRQIVRELPDFTKHLVELGYEADETWVKRLPPVAIGTTEYAGPRRIAM
jgi:hypothetical protein